MKAEIYNKDGSLSAYGFGCGYVQSVRLKDGRMKELYKESGVYHVRFDALTKEEKTGKFYSWNEHPKKQWKSFDKLSEAKQFFVGVKLEDVVS